ncbi:MAG: major facilitator superfamily domain-containing protein [Olpidium bornovanus]|uniref:Major facilitator superfamily domain-containing protein n=1 Tax=Olpidium bornovanus TaxID=278681 RepID=A0A8H8A2A3_9FUNG|nr:MAG: major facilitator superfamily domain-containing protein [Olpidium bornovanus]
MAGVSASAERSPQQQGPVMSGGFPLRAFLEDDDDRIGARFFPEDEEQPIIQEDGHAAVSEAISRIGMGRYQWVLFALCGTGWLADNMWIQAIAVAMPQLQIEFGVADDHIGFGLSSTFLGMLVGALGWGVTSDMWGRKLAFNMTLLITAVFGALAAFAPNFSIFCLFMMCLGMGVGGNLPVDGK